MDVRVRQATLEDQERIGQFLQIAYQDRAQCKFPARWLWLFVNNPFRGGRGLPIWLAELDGQIVGQTCEMIVPLKMADSVHPAAWGVDFIVLPEFRRHGIGRLLQRAQTDYHDIFMALSMSPISRHGLTSLGFTEANPAAELYKLIRILPEQARGMVDNKLGTGHILSRVCAIRCVAMGLAILLNFLTWLRDLVRRREGARTITIEPVERFGDELDQLWVRLAPRFPVIVERSAAYLNWKFTEQPDMNYDKFVARCGQTVCGYVVTRAGRPPEAKMGIIADLFAAPDDGAVIRRLLLHAVTHLRRKGVHYIIAASSVPEYVDHFLKYGFKKTREVIPMFRGKTAGQHPTNGWFLSMGDHDWDQYPMTTEVPSQGG